MEKKMISVYNNRIQLTRVRLIDNWSAIIKLPGHDDLCVDLGTPNARIAFSRAQDHYQATRMGISLDDAHALNGHGRKCWNCSNFMPRTNACDYEFPEVRQTGYKFANQCPLYDDGTPGD
jgi:hypothetical protein